MVHYPMCTATLSSTTLLTDQVCHQDSFIPRHFSVAMVEPTSTATVIKADDAPVTKACDKAMVRKADDAPVTKVFDKAISPLPSAETLVVKEAISPLPSAETMVMKELISTSHRLENCDEIIPNLYLGGFEAAENTEILIEHGICAVVCCNRELEFPSSKFSNRLEYYRVDVEDMGREPIEFFFQEATEFIHSQLKKERPVLVHCRAGVSRSSTILLAYLVEYHGYSLHDAFFLLLRLRPTITPNLGFMDKLKAYEEEKLQVPGSIDVDKYGTWFQTRERTQEPDLKPE